MYSYWVIPSFNTYCTYCVIENETERLKVKNKLLRRHKAELKEKKRKKRENKK